MKKYQKIIFILVAGALLMFLCACTPEEPEPTKDFNFEGPNLSDLLFNYYADHYTDTYVVSDGRVEIRAEYEFYSAWGCLSYYLAVENAVSKTVKDKTVAEVLSAPADAADAAENYFIEKYDWLSLKIRYLRFTQVTQIE